MADEWRFYQTLCVGGYNPLMDMGFARRFGNGSAPAVRNEKYALLVASAAARQSVCFLAGWEAPSLDIEKGFSDPVRGRIAYFSNGSRSAAKCRKGAFLPEFNQLAASRTNSESAVYRAALAIGKPRSYINGLPDLPVNLRGMED